jgi:hypothetical protein
VSEARGKQGQRSGQSLLSFDKTALSHLPHHDHSLVMALPDGRASDTDYVFSFYAKTTSFTCRVR